VLHYIFRNVNIGQRRYKDIGSYGDVFETDTWNEVDVIKLEMKMSYSSSNKLNKVRETEVDWVCAVMRWRVQRCY